MKKITYVLIVLLLSFCFNISNVFAYKPASECRTPGVEGCNCGSFGTSSCEYEIINGQSKAVTHYDADGNICGINPKSGQCDIAISGTKTAAGDDVDQNNEDIPDYLKNSNTVSCGHIKDIPDYVPYITNLTIIIFTIISMGMLAVMGTIDLFKGINSGNPDDMKKCQKAFYNRLGSAVLLFFLVALTKLLVGLFSRASGANFGLVDCINCFINNSCK